MYMHKHLGLHIDRSLTWKIHNKGKRQQVDLKIRRLCWLICPESQLNLRNKCISRNLLGIVCRAVSSRVLRFR